MKDRSANSGVSAQKDSYFSVAGRSEAEIRVRGSRFIGEAIHVPGEDSARSAIETIRKASFDATHHCFAYRLGPIGDRFRTGDDGEPTGTAGQPILQQIVARDLTDTAVVVTRYFGGIKLGRGGLIRAYGEAAGAALDQAKVQEYLTMVSFAIRFDYDDTSAAMRAVDSVSGRITSSQYSDHTDLTVDVRASVAETFESNLTQMLAGRGEIVRLNKDG